MKKIDLLCTEQDREAMQPIFEQLRAKGVRVAEKKGLNKKGLVLAVLSESFFADEEKSKALLDMISTGVADILPLKIDGSDIPDAIMNNIYSRNIIMAEGREAPLIAERIISGMPVKKSRLPLILSIAGIALLAVIGLVIVRSLQNRQPVIDEPLPEPTQIVVDLPMGLTAEDLEKIVDVIIVGDQVKFFTKDDVKTGPMPDWDTLATRDFQDGEAHWYSREDGHELPLTRYDDLSFLELMPNLSVISLEQIEAEKLPKLAGLKKLQRIMVMDSVIPDLEWVEGAVITKIDFINSKGTVHDLSPLTSCERLREVHIDLVTAREADLSGFAPPALDWLWINNANELQNKLDLSGLAACKSLRDCTLENLPLTDISFLSGAQKLEYLRLYNDERLTDISAVSGMTKLRELNIDDCNRIRDYSPISVCKALEEIFIETDRGSYPLRDASFLKGLPKLDKINLGGVELQDLGFLKSLSAQKTSLGRLGVWGTVGDWSALSSFKSYNSLNIDPDNGNNALRDRILGYLEGATINDLSLRRFNDIDLSKLPKITSRLELDRCGIKDLSTVPANWTVYNLNLNKCSNLRSLEGLQKQYRVAVLEVYMCPRLTDWSAIEGLLLNDLKITGCYTLPDFEKLTFNTLRLEGMDFINDLDFLTGVDTKRMHNFELVGLDALNNIQPLSRFKGTYITVQPQLAEQAEDLVKSKNYQEYRIEYPEGGWEMDDLQVSLQSFEELDTLPPALLRRINELCIVGDTVVDTSNGNIDEEWTNKGVVYYYQAWGSDEREKIQYGKGSADILEKISVLTGLKDLRLYKQPFTALDGIQNFTELEQLQLVNCESLKDASAVFACPNLHNLRMDNCPITSIQGVQNLWYLLGLNINNTKVSDLSPLVECDFSFAEEDRGGFELWINDLPVKDYSPLQNIPLKRIDFYNTDASIIVPLLEDANLKEFEAGSSFNNKKAAVNNELFAKIVRDHPNLEYIMVGWNQNLTDLSPVLELEGLQKLRVSKDMKKAISSLGNDYSFELEIDN